MTAHKDGLPEDKAEMKMMVHALIDGELDAAMALAMERRIAADPELAAEHARITALRMAMGNLPKTQPTQAFLARIQAIGSADTEQVAQTSVLPSARSRLNPELSDGIGDGQHVPRLSTGVPGRIDRHHRGGGERCYAMGNDRWLG